MDRLHPVERGGGIGQLADAIVEAALAATDTAEVEPQGGETAIYEVLVELLGDLLVHRPAALRVRMEDHRDGRARARRRRKTAFETALGAGEDDGRHGWGT